jgi:hypothetical protein
MDKPIRMENIILLTNTFGYLISISHLVLFCVKYEEEISFSRGIWIQEAKSAYNEFVV